MTTTADPPVIYWGRCRSGSRWFWAAQIVGGDDVHGWVSDRGKAAQRANAAAVKLAAGRYASIRIRDDIAEMKLAAATAAQAADAKAKGKTRASAEEGPADGYLYAIERGYWDYSDHEWIHARIVRLPIVRKTPRRIFYSRPSAPGESETGYIDRQEFEACGWVWSSRYTKICAEPPELEPEPPIIIRPPRPAPSYAPDLKALKAAMAAAHPDRGGTNEAFIAAHERYQRARRTAAR